MSTAERPVSDESVPQSSTVTGTVPSRCSHAVQFYAEDESLVDSMTRYVGRALKAGDAAIIVASSSHREALDRRLKATGIDAARAAKEGRYVSLDAAQALTKFMAEGWPDARRFSDFMGSTFAGAAAASQSGDVTVFGEMVAVLWAEGKPDAAIQLEELWNELGDKYSFTLLCAYPIAGFNRSEHEESFLKICNEHSALIPVEDYATLKSDEHRLLNVASLQQKAQSLETEKTERREAQETLQRRDAELADFLENALEGIQQTGQDQRILWANRALLKLLGYAPREYFGRYLSEFFVDQRNFRDFWAKLMGREEVYDHPADFKCKDGSVKHVLIHSNGLWENGRFLHTRTFIRDVTERKNMEQALKLANDELEMRVAERTGELRRKNVQILKQAEILDLTNQGLRELSARLMQVQDEERRRIARDLHDSTGQALALLSMNLSALEAEAAGSHPQLARGISENATLVRQVSEELRTLSYLLHPPLLEEMGLRSALQWYIDGFGQRSGVKVSFEHRGPERFPEQLEIAIFRVVQECLTNIHRHSESATANIVLHKSSGKVVLDISDEGKGIAPETLAKIESSGTSGVGLRGMRERIKDFGGELQIASAGKGTSIRITLPISA